MTSKFSLPTLLLIIFSISVAFAVPDSYQSVNMNALNSSTSSSNCTAGSSDFNPYGQFKKQPDPKLYSSECNDGETWAQCIARKQGFKIE